MTGNLVVSFKLIFHNCEGKHVMFEFWALPAYLIQASDEHGKWSLRWNSDRFDEFIKIECIVDCVDFSDL